MRAAPQRSQEAKKKIEECPGFNVPSSRAHSQFLLLIKISLLVSTTL